MNQAPDTHAMKSFDPARDGRRLRDAFGRFATGVTVVTAMSDDGPIGITANSFASVSLDPPLLLWCPAKTSQRYEAFCAAPAFSIQVLDGHQRLICDGFSRAPDAFDSTDWETGTDGTPLLRDCLARFECTRHAVHEAGDHSIVIGRIRQAAFRDGLPLLFQAGRFVSIKG